jgi:diaminopimelate epimerase
MSTPSPVRQRSQPYFRRRHEVGAFEKWQANGNDYIIIEQGALPFELTTRRVQELCRSHTGLGSDGILLISAPLDAAARPRVRVFNPDGSEDEMSGNGLCQASRYLQRLTGATSLDVETLDRSIHAEVRPDGTTQLALGAASLRSKDFPSGPPDGKGLLQVAGKEFAFRHVFVGNPQCAIEVSGPLADLEIEIYGPLISDHRLFPYRTNVAFWRPEADDEISVRSFERGVGETLSSGTGACGASVAAFLSGVSSPMIAHLPGGDTHIDVDERLHLKLRGRASCVFSGCLSPELISRLRSVR